MLGPRIVGNGGVELRPGTLEEYKLSFEWFAQPETSRFWSPRSGNWTEENAK